MDSPIHKLAAIVFTDIVGYTSIMQESEQKAWKQVKKHQANIEKYTKFYKGEVLQFYGDGSLSIFGSVTEAIEFAGRVQNQMKQNPHIPLRIGIHLGEIYFTEGKFVGDGINIASRVQSEAGQGEIFVSESVFQLAKNKSNFEFEFQGEYHLKNVQDPLKIYKADISSYSTYFPPHVHNWMNFYNISLKIILPLLIISILSIIGIQKINFGNQDPVENIPFAEPELESIIVLPFEDRNTDRSVEHIGYGIADEIRSKLSLSRQLNVKSMSTSLFLKDKKWTAQEIAENLNVDYIIEGSVTILGDEIRLNLSLIDALKDQLLHNLSFQSSTANDIIQLQNNVAMRVLDLIEINLNPSDIVNLNKFETKNLEAYKSYILGKNYLLKSSSIEDLKKSKEYFTRSIEADPNYLKAYNGIIESIIYPAAWGYADLSEAIEEAQYYLDQLNKIDPDAIDTKLAKCTLYDFMTNFDQAEIVCTEALRLHSEPDLVLLRLSRIMGFTGRYKRAFEYLDNAISLNPLSPVIKGIKLGLLNVAGEYERALIEAENFLKEHPNQNNLLFEKALSQLMLGQYEESIKTFLSRSVNPENNFALGYAYALSGQNEKAQKILQYLLDKQQKQFVPPGMIAAIYLGLDQKEKAYEWFLQEQIYFLKMLPIFIELRDDPNVAKAFEYNKKFLD